MLPPLVERALEARGAYGIHEIVQPRDGALAAGAGGSARPRTRVAEIGTGCCVGSAWILSALDPGVPFITVELDDRRAASAAGLLAEERERDSA